VDDRGDKLLVAWEGPTRTNFSLPSPVVSSVPRALGNAWRAQQEEATQQEADALSAA
jgi:hypothetical protein